MKTRALIYKSGAAAILRQDSVAEYFYFVAYFSCVKRIRFGWDTRGRRLLMIEGEDGSYIYVDEIRKGD